MIDPTAGKELAKELSKETLFAMARKHMSLSDATQIRAKSVSNDAVHLSVTTCRGDVCEMRPIQYPIDPPLASVDDWAKRKDTIVDEACAPITSWLVTKPISVVILGITGAMGVGTILLGRAGLEDFANNKHPLLLSIFGSGSIFATLVIFNFYLAVVAHGIEGAMAIYACKKQLGLGWRPALHWLGMVTLVGYPVFSEFQEMKNAGAEQEATKKAE